LTLVSSITGESPAIVAYQKNSISTDRAGKYDTQICHAVIYKQNKKK
jgi:hypothetical protein